MLGRLAPLFTISDAPFGINLRLSDMKLLPRVEPTLFAQAFEVTREWIRMELAELPAGEVGNFPGGFALRAATLSDVEAIVQLIYDSFEDPTVHPRGWAEAIVDNNRLVHLLEDGSSRAAGLLHLRPEDATTGYVSELAVHPDFQRRGLGEALMRWSFPWFRQQGLQRAALTTSPDNERAIALYRKLGFTVTEQGVDYRRSLDEDEVQQTLEKHNLAKRTNSWH
jgi:ribosomal protein S18 acetylase RimI-like enzyme